MKRKTALLLFLLFCMFSLTGCKRYDPIMDLTEEGETAHDTTDPLGQKKDRGERMETGQWADPQKHLAKV